MTEVLAGLAVVAAGGVLALLASMARFERLAVLVGVAGMLSGGALAALPAAGVLAGGPTLALESSWTFPGGSLALGVDRLSAFFLVTILGLSAASAVYGAGYLEAYRGKKRLGPVLLFYNLLAVAMSVVAVARNGALFLVAWELMTGFAFILVCFEDEREEVRSAGFTYLVLTHIAASFLVAFFLLLGRDAGSLDFERILAAPHPSPAKAALLFGLAVVGFGAKSGIWPLHIWLPEAHPAAPTHVSAVMSGVIVKAAIYGLVRGITLIGPPRAWWGVALLAIGAASGVLGVLYALAQHDLKRLLAYHTIENIGIILLGLGTGILGVAYGSPGIAILGFSGGLLHVLNHGVFKTLLFFGAGSVLHATGTRDIERLGGLARAMPWTAATFVVGATAISGLPPLNGFVSEWLVYAGFIRGGAELPLPGALATIGALAALALIGGLAAACFAKAFGVVFLGVARTDAARGAHECRASMLVPMVALAGLCVAIGLLPQLAASVVVPIAADLAGQPPALAASLTTPVLGPLASVSRAAFAFAGLLGGLVLLRSGILARRSVELARTWGCGFGAPAARMQYTASSFADSLLGLAREVLRPEVHDRPPEGYFPGRAHRSTHTEDLAADAVYRPLVRSLGRALAATHWVQRGRLQLYLLYVLVAIVALLVWQLAGGFA